MRNGLLLLIALPLAGCGEEPDCRKGLVPAAGALHDGVPVPVPRTWTGRDPASRPTLSVIVRDAGRWASLWRSLGRPAPPIDFSIEQGVVHFRRTTAAHAFDPPEIRTKDGIHRFLVTSRHSGETTSKATIHAIAAMPRSPLPVDLWYGHYDWARSCAQWAPQRRIGR
jgi:hypothetical protein